ncbi:MAG: 5'/3'-nucleotidase SurE [Chlorobi bacterium]|nr:5'/3'-nucleotidase SurE [Chlorobiota bacterium]
MDKKPLILVTNDDGITAPGIRRLIEVMNTLGEVVVVAPENGMSGQGHAITIDNTLYCDPVVIDDGPQKEFKSNGTPVDCVKLAIDQILDRKPDLLVSGINHGSNSSINIIYSGTMSAAVEGGIEGIPSIGFSLTTYKWNADFGAAQKYARLIASKVLEAGPALPQPFILNVNIPYLPESEIKGIRIARQAKAKWIESYDKRVNPRGREYCWLTGEFVNLDDGTDTDEYALQNGYVSIVPVQLDLTNYALMGRLKNWLDKP